MKTIILNNPIIWSFKPLSSTEIIGERSKTNRLFARPESIFSKEW